MSFLDSLNAIGDATRLRILSALEREELGVGEIARIVQLPQSTVSRHLKALHDAEWLVKRSVGTASMYRFSPALVDDDAARVWGLAKAREEYASAFADDLVRLDEVLRERRTDSREFFGRIGGEWDALRRDLFGEAFTAEALLGLIDPEWTVADIGCGTGNAAELIAPYVKKVVAIDRESAMLDAAKRRLADRRNIQFKRGDLTGLPLDDRSIDAALVFLVMHHVPDPPAAVAEIARTLRSGAVMLIVDMIAHRRDEYRHTMGHRHLGFVEAEVQEWARASALTLARFLTLRPDTSGRGPGLFAATLRQS